MILEEYLNAATMLIPTLITYSTAYTNVCTYSIFLGSAIHMPFSIAYHVFCAHHFFQDPVNCIGRKLDQMFIHIGSIFAGFGMFKSIYFMIGNVVINEYFIYCLWNTHISPLRRRCHVLLSILVYTSPMIWNGHEVDYFVSMTYLLLGTICFVKKDVVSYGHAIFHVSLGCFVYQLSHYCSISDQTP